MGVGVSAFSGAYGNGAYGGGNGACTLKEFSCAVIVASLSCNILTCSLSPFVAHCDGVW